MNTGSKLRGGWGLLVVNSEIPHTAAISKSNKISYAPDVVESAGAEVSDVRFELSS